MKQFTSKDVCTALGGVSRTHVHQWAQLPPFSDRPSQERSARRYSRVDLLTFAVFYSLEEYFGFNAKRLAVLSGGIHDYLATPRGYPQEEWVYIRLTDGKTSVVGEITITESGLVIDIAEVRERIDIYLGLVPPQRDLPLMVSA